MKCTNICIIGVPEGEEREKRHEKIFEEIIAENFPNMGKETVQESQRIPYKVNPRWNTPRHLLIKLAKIKDIEKILKATKEKQQIILKGIPQKVISWFFQKELCRPEGSGMIYLRWWKGKTYN